MDFSEIKVEPIRFIPFDLGGHLSNKIMGDIKFHLSKKYQLKELSLRQEVIFSKKPIYSCLDKSLDLYLFSTGIGVFVVKEPVKIYQEDMFFSAEYLKERKLDHHLLLNWEHSLSPLMRIVLQELREIVKGKIKKPRPSASENWENNGFSYVMSIAFFQPASQTNENIKYEELPAYLQKGIPVILNPSYLNITDSILLSHNTVLDDEQILELLNDIDERPFDYELRKHVMCFMSWAAVVIIGNVNEYDKDEWTLLEVELQHYWYYIYCLNKSLPTSINDQPKVNLTVEKILTLKMEAEIIKEDVQYINDSSIPERFKPIINGLISTSGILDQINRFTKHLNFWESIIQAKQESQKRLLIQTSEILIFAVAYLQIAPDLYNYFVDPSIKSVSALVKVIGLFLVGSALIFFKIRYR